MKKRIIGMLCLLAATAVGLSAESLSVMGTLSSPEDVSETTFTLTAADTVTFQTWGFGGGTNAAGNVIQPGGFDPLISLFSGSGPTATIVTDGASPAPNPLADGDNLLNPPWSYVGNCPTAGMVSIGGGSVCGDDFMQTTLAAGVYTLVLTDANYTPFAVYDNGTLSEGFSDLSGGIFQTYDSVSNASITPNGRFAVDIVTANPDLATPTPTPEPSTLPLLCIGLAVLASARRFNQRRVLLRA